MDNYPTSQQEYEMDEHWRREDEWHRQDEKNNFGMPYGEKERKHNEETIKNQTQGDTK